MDPVLLRALAVAAGVVVIALIGRWWQGRDGDVRHVEDGDALGRDHLDALGLDLSGASRGAVLLGSPTCTPCVQVKRVLTELASRREGFRWVYADAADHLALTEEHRVLRVPTLFVVDASGRILARTSGVPDADALARVLDVDRRDRGDRCDGLAA
jgi:thiol-disulfide isomerase/thioredoxin